MHADDGNCCVKCLKWSANCVAFFIYLITVGLCGFFLYTMIVQTDTKAAANDAVESHEVGGFTMPWYASVAIVLFVGELYGFALNYFIYAPLYFALGRIYKFAMLRTVLKFGFMNEWAVSDAKTGKPVVEVDSDSCFCTFIVCCDGADSSSTHQTTVDPEPSASYPSESSPMQAFSSLPVGKNSMSADHVFAHSQTV
mmetsp:Transcript_48790/g.115987  ORF Transcript_48790/g.115987 Transcript_48790/m.115987 type:complete len:197 (+) Transcript_48790:73-663(+)